MQYTNNHYVSRVTLERNDESYFLILVHEVERKKQK